MVFEEQYIYHIYNQGNNRRKIFFSRDNYLFFLHKLKNHIKPHAHILAWCLMPNHFHLMVYLHSLNINANEKKQAYTPKEAVAGMRSFNQSIGIMLRSYTRAVNRQQNFTGTLFRKETKAECVNCPNGVKPAFISEKGITKITSKTPEEEYPQVCFNYIHQNPVKAGLAASETDWEYSSALDYAGIRNGSLVNKTLAAEFISTKSGFD